MIKLLEFNGDYMKWMFFKDSFETTIHQDVGLTAMQKHQYLIGVLQGETRSVIQGFKISNENYENVSRADYRDTDATIIKKYGAT